MRCVAAAALLSLAAQDKPAVTIEKSGAISFPGRVSKHQYEDKLKGVIEYAIVFKGGKEYESPFVTDVDPMELFEAMKKAGLKPGKPASEENGKKAAPEGSKVNLWIRWTDGGKDRRERLESFVLDTETKKAMAEGSWVFTGSREGYDPDSDKTVLQVVQTRNLIGLQHSDATVLLQNPSFPKNEHQYKTNKDVLPKEGTAVTIEMEPEK